MATKRIIESWNDLRTLGAVRQAMTEAEQRLKQLPGGFNSDEVYTDHDGSPSCAVYLVAIPMGDGSEVYNVEFRTGDE